MEFFVHANGDHDERRAGQVRVISVADLHDRRERRAVLQIGHTAFARLRSRFTTTISRAMPRRMLDNRQAEPTAPAPITPIFDVTAVMRHCPERGVSCS
jgi:hypothetical protein